MQFGLYYRNSISSIGPIRWEIIDKKEGKALLLCQTVLDIIPLAEHYQLAVWEFNKLRKWLNKEFLEQAFSLEEQ